ncbi:MAG TPA: M23 family metallopeptidase [Actinoplanes sp.]|nr:M23 family metallopeptidase [Actinoplanes sp.]
MRQRLSSEPDRYRGRRRVPTPPRSRYAVVVTSAFVGAGIVALGAATNLPDAKAVNPSVLQGLENAALAKDGLADRNAAAERASRADERNSGKAGDNDDDLVPLAADDAQTDIWSVPIDEEYDLTSQFDEQRFGEPHAGIDLRAPEGTLYKAVHGGVVTKAGYDGGYGYAVTVRHPNGTETIYGHSRKVLVQAGQVVKAGDVLGEVGSTGNTFGVHLHLEIQAKDDEGKLVPIDPIPILSEHGVDIDDDIETIYSDLAAG